VFNSLYVRRLKVKIFVAVISMVLLSSTVCSAQPFQLDEHLYGSWIKAHAGHAVHLSPNGDVWITMNDSLKFYTGPGNLERCIDGPLCISTRAFGKCGFAYSFRKGGVMNLSKTVGSNICDELSGDYTREDL
jgi:hypothetical protein